MEEKLNHIHTTTLAFALTVCLLFIAMPHSHSQPPPPLCGEQSYRCSINVSAIFDPLWGQNPPSQCNGAFPLSQLICDARNGSQNFTVKEIDKTSHTMTVVPTHTVKDVCSNDFYDFYQNLNKNVLQYYASVHNVTVFYGCPEIPDFPSKCKGSLYVATAATLDHYDYSDDGAGVLEEAHRNGFEVYYALPPNCTRCSLSNPSCRSDGGNDEDIVSCKYYCPDQHCSPSKSTSSIFSIPSLLSYFTLSYFIVTKNSVFFFFFDKLSYFFYNCCVFLTWSPRLVYKQRVSDCLKTSTPT